MKVNLFFQYFPGCLKLIARVSSRNASTSAFKKEGKLGGKREREIHDSRFRFFAIKMIRSVWSGSFPGHTQSYCQVS